jgi:hypothetical protein
MEVIVIGIVAWVFTHILIDSDMIFEKWWTVLNRLPIWLSKPLGSCEYCLSGQLALWCYLYQSWLVGSYNALEHIAYISIAIFTVKIINRVIYGVKND